MQFYSHPKAPPFQSGYNFPDSIPAFALFLASSLAKTQPPCSSLIGFFSVNEKKKQYTLHALLKEGIK